MSIDPKTKPKKAVKTATRERLAQFFDAAIMWQGTDYLPGTDKRARWVAADAMRDQAKLEERSMAQRLRLAAGKIESGSGITKKWFNLIGLNRWKKIEDHYLRRCCDLLG